LKINAPDPEWWDITTRLTNAEDVEPVVFAMLAENWQPNVKYKQIVDAVFGYRDGNSGKRAAEIIRSIIRAGKGCRYGSDYSGCRLR
jgi:hypothetical protein